MRKAIYCTAVFLLGFTRAIAGGGGMVSDSVLSKRLRSLQDEFRVEYHEHIRNEIQHMGIDAKSEWEELFMRFAPYQPVIAEVLEESNLPAELQWIAFAQSRAQMTHTCANGASGIWGLHYIDAIRWKLFVDSDIDLRYDCRAATVVAAEKLQSLHRVFQSWDLAFLAYFTSPSYVKGAQLKSGSTRFWDIFEAIPCAEKWQYCTYVSALYISNYASEFEISVSGENYTEISTKEFFPTSAIFLDDIATAIGVSTSYLQELNPVFTGLKVPVQPVIGLHIPTQLESVYLASESQLYAKAAFHATEVITSPQIVTTPDSEPEEEETEENEQAVTDAGETAVRHTVKAGETLYNLSVKYGVSIDQIKTWNNKTNDVVYVGDVLEITPNTQPETAEKEVKKEDTPVPAEKKKTTTTPTTSYVTYKVKSGDSLWGISQKYGVTDSAIKKLNSLTSNTIYPGQILKIKKQN